MQVGKKDWKLYLDALEGLRIQRFPDEPITTKTLRNPAAVHWKSRDPTLRQELAIIYASGAPVSDLPTVESLRFTTRRLQQYRPRQSQPYDPRWAMRSRPHPFAPLPPDKLVIPQGALPPPPAPNNAPATSSAAPLFDKKLFRFKKSPWGCQKTSGYHA